VPDEHGDDHDVLNDQIIHADELRRSLGRVHLGIRGAPQAIVLLVPPARRVRARPFIRLLRDLPRTKCTHEGLWIGLPQLQAAGNPRAERARRHGGAELGGAPALQATIGLEILDEITPATVYVPVGGGGLIAGIAAAVKHKRCAVRIVGVEPRSENDAFMSWRAGERIGLPRPSPSIADAIKVQIPGELTFPLMRLHVHDMVLVDDAEIVDAMRLYVDRTGHRLEPAGAAALAAAMTRTSHGRGSIVCLGSGQNVTPERFQELKLKAGENGLEIA